MIDGTFKLGEIATFQNVPAPYSFLNNEECEIIGGFELRDVFDFEGNTGIEETYLVKFSGGKCAATPEYLKKMPPPSMVRDAELELEAAS